MDPLPRTIDSRFFSPRRLVFSKMGAIFVCVLLLLSGCTRLPWRGEVTGGSLTAYGKTVTIDAETAQSISNAIVAAPDAVLPLPLADTAQFTLTTSKRTYEWTLYPYAEAGQIYIEFKKGFVRLLSTDLSAKLLSLEPFDAFYNAFSPWFMTVRSELSVPQAITLPPDTATWAYPIPIGERQLSWKKDGEAQAISPFLLSETVQPSLLFERIPNTVSMQYEDAQGQLSAPFTPDKPWPVPEPGTYTVRIQTNLSMPSTLLSGRMAKGEWVYSFPVMVEKKTAIMLSSTTLEQGDFLGVTVIRPPDEALQVKASWLSKPIPLVDWQEMRVALVEIQVDLKPGTYSLSVQNEAGEAIDEGTFEIAVAAKAFQKSEFTVSSDLAEKRSDDNLNTDGQKIGKARANLIQVPLWVGNFVWPLDGTHGTGFGAQRLINGELNYRHSGIDISAPRGTPIVAPNSGRVILAEELIVTGFTVIIDHGLGMTSSYSHMDRLDVTVGMDVKQGDQLGVVGSTGFSTGPHLHFAMSLHGKFVDPHVIIAKDPLEAARTAE